MGGYREEGRKPLWQPSPDQVGQNYHLTPTLRVPAAATVGTWHEARRMLDTKGWCRYRYTDAGAFRGTFMWILSQPGPRDREIA